jgi:lipoate-protein ligase A
MTCLDLTLPTPEENLACDEALLETCENNDTGEILRFWEPRNYFVVLGYANQAATEVDLEACAAKKIAVLRRCSGGGAVLQGPGCLNYALVLRIDEGGPLHSITTANCFIMRRHRDALRKLVSDSIRVAGHTDLALVDSKFSGNAQRRRKSHLLFHGTFLMDFDISLIEKLLRTPSRQPDYRENRAHREFLRNLDSDRAAIQQALQTIWCASESIGEVPLDQIHKLVEEKYSRADWNFKF